MSLPYYKKFPRDFIEGTIGMSLELKGAYSLILDMIYMQDGKLPDDAKYISGMLGCSVKKWNCIRSTLIEKGKIYVSGEFLHAEILKVWRSYKRESIPSHISNAVYARDGEKCAYCGDVDGPFHLDHVIPWTLCAEHSIDNLVVACAPCNWSKGSKTLEEWRWRLQ